MIIGILVHLKGSSAHWIHVVYTNTSMVQQLGLIDSKGEEGMLLRYCSIYIAKFKPDSGL